MGSIPQQGIVEVRIYSRATPPIHRENAMTTHDRAQPDAARSESLKLLQADIHAATIMGNLGLAARLTMRYLHEATGLQDEPAAELGH